MTAAPSNILTTARLRLEPVDDRHFDGLRAINGDAEGWRLRADRQGKGPGDLAEATTHTKAP